MADDDVQRFTEIWERYAPRVTAYCLRNADQGTAEEAVSETFLVAWRRLRQLPEDPLPWLLVVARNTLANLRRSRHRYDQMVEDLARVERLAAPATAADVTALDRAAVLRAVAKLSAKEREALLLVAWDGLAPADAARVAGCSRPAFHVRLHRARARLRAAVEDVPTEPDRPAAQRIRGGTR